LLGKLFGLLIPGSGNRRINWNRNPPENRIIPSFVSQLSLPILWIAALLLLFPLKDSRPGITQDAYDRAWKLFQHGRLADSQREAEENYRRFRISDPALAAKFQLLEAEAMVWRGLYEDALRILATHSTLGDPEETIRKLSLEAVALTHQRQDDPAEQKLTQAASICKAADYGSCGDVIRARGILAVRRGLSAEGRNYLLESSSFAQAHHDPWLETNAELNLGWAAIQTGHFDESVDWSRAAYRQAKELGAEDLAQVAASNLGWAYLQLGDDERALGQFINAEKSARDLGNVRDELKWIAAAGYVYQDSGEFDHSTTAYLRALALATRIGSKDDIVNALEDLAQVSVDAGRLDQAASYLKQISTVGLAAGGLLGANVQMTEGMLAAARGQNAQAESLLRTVRQDQSNPVTLRLSAGGEMARLFEAEDNLPAAEQIYQSTLDSFDAAQAELKSEESQLPFVGNAARVYDGYIHLLLRQKRSEDALGVADRSRARTLAQSLGGAIAKPGARIAALNATRIASRTGATLLFYWLGQTGGSCLWAVTPAKATYFALPPQAEIAARVDRYKKSVLDGDPLASQDQGGQALYRMLISPAEKLIQPGGRVVILADGALSQLNFETLLAPGPSSYQAGSSLQSAGPPSPDLRGAPLHYWLDDVTIISAPSLAMLAAAKPTSGAPRNLLLLGNPISASEDFPTLPLFAFEAKKIQTYFDARNVAAFTGAQATPAAYLASNPARYSYIHFVSHAVSSRTAPLDSAIILSPTSAVADSYKLYARDIMRHPIDAELVTISACYGSGTRSYAGEGLVGLSWAFLHAGAHSVIGALWEASDDSSPRLMDKLYQGIEDGQTPAVSLRQAKLSLLHSGGKFQQPFFWAPFQLYSSR
jgi:CHAT domain-containing protein/tetratricopeptide (TPR) repeat protein